MLGFIHTFLPLLMPTAFLISGHFLQQYVPPNPHIVIVVTISTRIKVGVFVTNSMYYNFPELE